jgi:hypothetical protein
MANTYEVGVFNKEVRDAMREGERHKHLKDEWADIHYIEVTADDEHLARAEVMRRYRPENGYVVTSVVKLKS